MATKKRRRKSTTSRKRKISHHRKHPKASSATVRAYKTAKRKLIREYFG